MNEDIKELEFIDEEAIEFIWNLVPEQDRTFTKDDIQYLLDVIYDFYDEKGLIDEDTTEEAAIDEEALYNYALKAVKKDGINLSTEAVQLILDGEYQYGLEKGIYEEDEEC